MDIIQARHIMLNRLDHLRLPHPPELNHGAAFCNGRYSSYDYPTVAIQDMGFVHSNQLRQADEAFLSSTAGGIMPIRSVDGQALGAGDNWTKVAVLYDRYSTQCWEGWGHPSIAKNSLRRLNNS